MSKLNLLTTAILLTSFIILLINPTATTITMSEVDLVCAKDATTAECENISQAFLAQDSKQFWLNTGLAFANIINLVFIAIKIGIKHSNQNRVTAFSKFTSLFFATVEEPIMADTAGTYSIYTNKAYKPSTISLSDTRKYGIVPTAKERGAFKHQHIYVKQNVGGQTKLVHVKSI
ncbi:MAG: hypothetical protein ABS904_00245 [Solibacillus isronensis]